MLNKHNLNIATLCSKDSSRYTLGGINVRQDRTEVTDGHLLVVVDTPKAESENFPPVDGFTPTDTFSPFILPQKDALDIAKAIPKPGKYNSLPITQHVAIGSQTDVNGNAYFAVTDCESPKTFNPRKLQGLYPNVDFVIPKKEDATLTIAFNAELLSNLCKVLAGISDDENKTIIMRFTDNCGAVRIDCDNNGTKQHATAALMPVRCEE